MTCQITFQEKSKSLYFIYKWLHDRHLFHFDMVMFILKILLIRNFILLASCFILEDLKQITTGSRQLEITVESFMLLCVWIYWSVNKWYLSVIR